MRKTEKQKISCDGCGVKITLTFTMMRDFNGWALVPDIEKQLKKKKWKLTSNKKIYCPFCKNLNN